MTPNEVNLIHTSSEAIEKDPDGFSASFYETVFDLAPAARALFPDDMGEQQRKLVRELRFMIGAATALAAPSELANFVARTQELGRRHVGYGVIAAMYEPVGAALIATLRETVDSFDDDHERAWTKLFGLVAETMLEGASQAETMTPAPSVRVTPQQPCDQYVTTGKVSVPHN